MKKFLFRDAKGSIELALENFNCVLLLGPRQVGKTELSRKVGEEIGTAALYLDAEQPDDRKALNDFDAFASAHSGKLIILDEIQCAPELFPRLRSHLDKQENANTPITRWLLLGSATTLLYSLASANLGGRYKTIELTPFQLNELLHKLQAKVETASFDIESTTAEAQLEITTDQGYESMKQLWLRGGFPKSFLAKNDDQSLVWRQEYLRSIFGPQSFANNSVTKPKLLSPLWERLSVNQGCPCNFNDLPVQLGCTRNELKELLDFLVQSKLLNKLRPWWRNENKRLNQQPLYFVRDSGLLHTQWGFLKNDVLVGHTINGKSWEGFVLETLTAVAPNNTGTFFYRNNNQDEIDIVLEFNPKRRWAIEVKLSEDAGVSKGFYRACEEIEAENRFVVHGGPKSIKIKSGEVDALCLTDAINLVLTV